MTTNKTRLEKVKRELDRRAPEEPVTIRIVWTDWRTGEAIDDAGEVVIHGEGTRVINLKWPDDEDEEKRTFDVAPGEA